MNRSFFRVVACFLGVLVIHQNELLSKSLMHGRGATKVVDAESENKENEKKKKWVTILDGWQRKSLMIHDVLPKRWTSEFVTMLNSTWPTTDCRAHEPPDVCGSRCMLYNLKFHQCSCKPGLAVHGIPAEECHFQIQNRDILVYEPLWDGAAATVALEMDSFMEYGQFHGYDLKSGDTVIDIGANLGMFSITLAKHHKDITVLSYEMSPRTFAFLEHNVQANHLSSRVRAFNRPVTGDGRILQFVSCASIRSGRTSIKRKCAPGDASATTTALQSTTVNAILEEHGIKNVALLKIDCEGCEEEVMPQIPWSRIKQVTGECHGSEKCCQFCPRCQNCPSNTDRESDFDVAWKRALLQHKKYFSDK